MQLRARPALLLAFTALVATAWATSPALQDEIVTVPVAGGVHCLEGHGGNVGVLATEGGTLIVDTKFERDAPAIRAAVEALGGGPVRYVVNTHFHGDHTGGNPAFGPEATIVAHENVHDRMSKPRTRGGRTQEPAAEVARPVVTFEDGLTLRFGGHTLRLEHYPGCHTDGDTVVFFEEANAVHMGDLFFSGRFPYVDRDSGGSVRGLARSVAGILKRVDEETAIIPGHGPVSTRADLARYHAMLTTVLERVGGALAEGRTIEDMRRAKLLEDYEDWSWQFIPTDGFIQLVGDELSAD